MLILDRSMVCRWRTPTNYCWTHGRDVWNPLARINLVHTFDTPQSCSGANASAGTCPTNNLTMVAYSQDYGTIGWAGISQYWWYEFIVDGQPHRHWFKGYVVNNTTSSYLNRDQNNICHEVGHQLGLDHWYDQRESCLEDSVLQITGGRVKTTQRAMIRTHKILRTLMQI